jgi:hypothetical protein
VFRGLSAGHPAVRWRRDFGGISAAFLTPNDHHEPSDPTQNGLTSGKIWQKIRKIFLALAKGLRTKKTKKSLQGAFKKLQT